LPHSQLNLRSGPKNYCYLVTFLFVYMAQSSVITIKTTIKYFMKEKYIALIFMCIFVLNMRRFFSEFMRCFSSVFVRHFTPSIPYAIPPTVPPIIPPTISLYIRPSVPLSVSPITCIERSKQGVTFNRKLFALIGGVFVFCSFALGNHWYDLFSC